MLKLVPDPVKNMCKRTVKELPFAIRYVPDQYKTQEMCDKVILEKSRKLEFVSDCYKYQEIGNKAFDKNAHVL